MAQRTVNLVQLSTALRDQPYAQTDSDCQMSFNEISNVSSFRVVSASIPVSQYTFSANNKKLTYGYETPSSFVAGDYIEGTVSVFSTMGEDSGAFNFRILDQTGLTLYTRSAVIPPRFLTLTEILNIFNTSGWPARVIYNAGTRKLEIEIDPPSAGQTLTATLEINAYFPLGVLPALVYTRAFGGPTTDVEPALKVVSLQNTVAATASFRWTPTTTTIFSFSDLITSLNATITPAITSIMNTNTINGPWISSGPVFRQLYMQNSNFIINVTGFSSNAAAVTGFQYGELFPSPGFQNFEAPVAYTRISPNPANLSIINYSFTNTDYVFDTDRLYTEADILTALNTEFTPLAATWTADHNRLKITTSSAYAVHLGSNEVLGLRAPDWIVVPKEESYQSPYVYDLSGGTDLFYVGIPNLYQSGRTSQGSGPSAIRRRDIVLSVVNTSSVAFGSYVTFYDQSGLFIPLGATQSVSNIQIVLYDQRFQRIATTNGIPVHLSIEFV